MGELRIRELAAHSTRASRQTSRLWKTIEQKTYSGLQAMHRMGPAALRSGYPQAVPQVVWVTEWQRPSARLTTCLIFHARRTGQSPSDNHTRCAL